MNANPRINRNPFANIRVYSRFTIPKVTREAYARLRVGLISCPLRSYPWPTNYSPYRRGGFAGAPATAEPCGENCGTVTGGIATGGIENGLAARLAVAAAIASGEAV
jgi:hypothetical protein